MYCPNEDFSINNLLNTFLNAVTQLKAHLPISVGFLAILLCIHILNWMTRYRLSVLGIHARTNWGFIGIPFFSFLHADMNHLLFNMLPLFAFSNFILLQNVSLFFASSIIIILISGVLVWLFARHGIHVGASCLIMGYLGFICVSIYLNPTALSIVIGLVCVYYFGGMFAGLLPSRDKTISWEGHVFGFIAGIATAMMLLI